MKNTNQVMPKTGFGAARAVLCMALAIGVAGTAGAVSPLLKEFEDAFIRLHEEVRPCVVNIDTKGSVPTEGFDPDQLEDLFRFFGLPQPKGAPNFRQRLPIRQGTGSGFIIDKEGHIITNNHVVEGAAEIVVRLWDGSEYDAKRVGTDRDTDIAVIKIDADVDLPVAKLGDSETLKVGQFVVATGSPRGFEGSLSFGHISALGRSKLRLRGLRFQDFIQTDAAINLGNSGGPLCNIDGEVIGINVAIVLGANSLGFAIPINTAKEILSELISEGEVTRGYLGVGISDVDQLVADGLGLEDTKGALVERVMPDTPAERAGLKPYDIIRKVNDDVVEDADDVIRLISIQSPGSTVSIEVWRDEKAVTKKVELEKWMGAESMAPPDKEILGLRVQTLTAETAEQLGLDPGTRGVVITDIEPGSTAHEAGLAPGEVITEVAREPVATADEFFERVREHAKPGKGLLLGLIRRDGESDITAIKVPKDAELE